MTHAVPEDPKETPHAEPTRTARSGMATDLARAAVSPNDASGLARLAGKSLLRAMGALTKGSIDTANEIAHEFNSGEPVTEIVDHRVEQVRSAAWSALGIDERLGGTTARRSSKGGMSKLDLKSQGTALLDNSWNVANQPRGEHPSFRQILDSLVPDEARILRFLAVGGPQPSIDVRTKKLFGVGSERLAGGINMIADMAGCAWPDRDAQYLANLNRLGLIRFSQEPVEDYRRYSLIGAQPRSMEAQGKAKKTMEVYRSIYLSLFGMQFCEACFVLDDGYTAGGWNKNERGDSYIGKGPREYHEKEH